MLVCKGAILKCLEHFLREERSQGYGKSFSNLLNEIQKLLETLKGICDIRLAFTLK